MQFKKTQMQRDKTQANCHQSDNTCTAAVVVGTGHLPGGSVCNSLTIQAVPESLALT